MSQFSQAFHRQNCNNTFIHTQYAYIHMYISQTSAVVKGVPFFLHFVCMKNKCFPVCATIVPSWYCYQILQTNTRV